MLGERLAEGLALLGVADRILHRRPGDADAARRDVDPPQLQPAERVAQAEALLAADQVGGRDAVVVEDQFGGIDALVAELPQLAADGAARHLRRDEQAGSLLARRGAGRALPP